jgi:hypothetical protein
MRRIAIEWVNDVGALPDGPLILVGNELFDAVPIHQYVRTGGVWRERLVGLDNERRLAFVTGPGAIDPALLPPGADQAPEGSIAELAPARIALMDRIATRIAGQGGAGLFIDYGHLVSGFGDTLQAMRGHAYDGIFAAPGEADLTSHVDFEALAAQADFPRPGDRNRDAGSVPFVDGSARASRTAGQRRRRPAGRDSGPGRAPRRKRPDGRSVQGSLHRSTRVKLPSPFPVPA